VWLTSRKFFIITSLLFSLSQTTMNVSHSTQDSDNPAAHGMKTTEAVDTADSSAYITFVNTRTPIS
jgi:hypothetical protein